MVFLSQCANGSLEVDHNGVHHIDTDEEYICVPWYGWKMESGTKELDVCVCDGRRGFVGVRFRSEMVYARRGETREERGN